MSTYEAKAAEEFMIHQPELFYQLYTQTVELNNSAPDKPALFKEIKESKPVIPVKELGDIHLFLAEVFSGKYDCSRFVKNPKLDQIEDAEPYALLLETVLSNYIPRNDKFRQMYNPLKQSS